MALTPKNNAPAFEAMEDDHDTVTEVGTAAPVAAPSLPAVRQSAAVAAFAGAQNVFASIKNSFTVEYNTLPSIKATNGNLVERETNAKLGDSMVLEIMSWQDSYVVSPGDDKAPKEIVKYSDDGIICKDGTPVNQHLADLRAMGYTKAKVNQRVVIVGSVVSTAKLDHLNDQLVQIDCSPMSRSEFTRYQAQAMNLARLGRADPAKLTTVRCTATLARSGDNDFTKICFAAA